MSTVGSDVSLPPDPQSDPETTATTVISATEAWVSTLYCAVKVTLFILAFEGKEESNPKVVKLLETLLFLAGAAVA